jgi:hypothetical protein
VHPIGGLDYLFNSMNYPSRIRQEGGARDLKSQVHVWEICHFPVGQPGESVTREVEKSLLLMGSVVWLIRNSVVVHQTQVPDIIKWCLLSMKVCQLSLSKLSCQVHNCHRTQNKNEPEIQTTLLCISWHCTGPENTVEPRRGKTLEFQCVLSWRQGPLQVVPIYRTK